MRQIKLTKSEKEIEQDLLKGEYINVNKSGFEEIAQAIARRRKDAVINIRVNSQDLIQLKGKAKKLGIPYQTLLSEVIHKVAS